MRATGDIAGRSFTWAVPPTTRDVLDWRVWILSLDDNAEQVTACVEWAAKWLIGVSADELALWAAENGGLPSLVEVCARIVTSAELPASVAASVSTLLDRQSGIDPLWSPTPACDCPRCRGKAANPEGVTCLYDGIDPRAVGVASHLLGLENAEEPYYITQARAIARRAEGRRMAHEREQREEQDRWNEFRKRKTGGR